MAKSATKKKSNKSTKSSVPKKVLKLDSLSKQAVSLLQTSTTMEFLQLGATAIRDLGVYDVEKWSGGFENLYKITFNNLFDEDRNLREQFYPIVIELRTNTSCGADPQMLAAALGRIAYTLTFTTIATERNS